MPSWFSIRAAAKASDPVEILIYDQIGKDWWSNDGVSAKEFAEALKAIDAKSEIRVSINSPGGNVWDGLAIYNQLRARKQFVTCRVDGVAASIASIIALSGRRLEMPENALFMIHDPAALCMGGSDDMRAMAETLDKHADLLAGVYAGKTGRSREKMRDLMADETWMTGAEALHLGFADELTEEVKMAATATFDLSKFRRAPAALVSQPQPPPPPNPRRSDEPPPQSHLMQKTAIFALLKEHGKTLPDTATDEQILTALSDLVTNGKVTKEDADKLKKPAERVLVDADRIQALERDVREQKERRLRAEISELAATRPGVDVDKWLPRAMLDEGVIADLRALPAYSDPGVEPLRRGIVTNLGNSLIEDYRKMKAGQERSDFAVAHWNELHAAHESSRVQMLNSLPLSEQVRRLHQPRAANSYSASLVTDRLSDQIVTTIGTKLAALRGFSREFGVDQMKPRATVQVGKVTAGSTTQTNATNFEPSGASADSTKAAISVSVSQLTQTFHATNDELQKGHRVQHVAAKNAQAFANAINDVWTALLTVGNYGAATVIGAAANFDALDLAPIYALAKNYGQKNLILDGGHLAFLLPTDKFKFRLGEEGAYNFDLIAENNRWTGATANTVGFICDPQSIAVCSGLPVEMPGGEFIELTTTTVESLGLSVLVAHWYSRAARTHWMSFDIMFGAAAGDTTAAEHLVTA